MGTTTHVHRVLTLSAGVGLALVVAAGCGDDGGAPQPPDASAPDASAPDATPVIAPECNPLGSESCLMPWPSAAYLVEDGNSATGVRLELPAAAMPVNSQGVAVQSAPFDRFDGFAPSGPMIVSFPGGVSPEGLPGHEDPAAAMAADAPVVVVDMDSGERLLVFAEVDAAAIFPEDRALIIRPMVRMRPGTRYAVAIRNTVKSADGGALPRPPGFQAILDDDPGDHPLMARLAPRYDDIFAALADEGISRDELVLAWDFVTASDEFLTADLVSMRTQAQTAMGTNGANLSFSLEAMDTGSAALKSFLVGTHEAPNFLSNGAADDSVLVRDSDGLPRLDGTYDAALTALIPACVDTATLPRPALVFGHGLFGSGQGSLLDDKVHQVANDACVVIVAGDFIGLSSGQVDLAAAVASDVNRAGALTEKLGQSVVNFLALSQILRGPLSDDARFRVNDVAIVDPDQVYYLGASLGGIMGNVVMAYDPSLPRGVLGVPGGAWSLLLERSYAWRPLQVVATRSYEDPHDYQLLAALVGMRFEPYDAVTTAARVTGTPLPDTPVKQVLLYETVGDSLVSNLSTELIARTMGLQVLTPSVREPYGLSTADGPLSSGLVIYDEQPTPLPPTTNEPPSDDNGTHSGINTRPAVLRQATRFLLEGEITSECKDGGTVVACDCTVAGVCD